jgi:hypothetical protein
MNNITIRELKYEDKEAFLKAMLNSQPFHHPWVTPPLNSQEFILGTACLAEDFLTL